RQHRHPGRSHAGQRAAQPRADPRRRPARRPRRAVPVPQRARNEDRAGDFHAPDRRYESDARGGRAQVLPALPAAARRCAPDSASRHGENQRAMSLLMKALEKAAKDRVEARTEAPVAEPAPEAAPAGRSELTLEPLAAATPEPPGGAAPPLRGEPPVRP